MQGSRVIRVLAIVGLGAFGWGLYRAVPGRQALDTAERSGRPVSAKIVAFPGMPVGPTRESDNRIPESPQVDAGAPAATSHSEMVNRLTKIEGIREVLRTLLAARQNARQEAPLSRMIDFEEIKHYSQDLDELVDQAQSDPQFETIRPEVNLAAVISGVRGKESFRQLGAATLEKIRSAGGDLPHGTLSASTSAYVMILASASTLDERKKLSRELDSKARSSLEKAAISAASSYIAASDR